MEEGREREREEVTVKGPYLALLSAVGRARRVDKIAATEDPELLAFLYLAAGEDRRLIRVVDMLASISTARFLENLTPEQQLLLAAGGEAMRMIRAKREFSVEEGGEGEEGDGI